MASSSCLPLRLFFRGTLGSVWQLPNPQIGYLGMLLLWSSFPSPSAFILGVSICYVVVAVNLSGANNHKLPLLLLWGSQVGFSVWRGLSSAWRRDRSAKGEPSLWSSAGVHIAECSHVCRLGILSITEGGRGTAGIGLGHESCVVLLMNQHLWVKEYLMGNSPNARRLAPWWWEMWGVLEASWLRQRYPVAKVKAKQNSHWK